jgi:regulator of RNase E activity RraA
MLPGLAALCRAPRGYIILINNTGRESDALAGDLFTTDAIAGGFAGLIVNGAVRDTAQLREMSLPIFAKEVNFISAGTGPTPPRTPELVELGGISIRPNDWIFADEDGMLLVRGEYLRYVLAGAAVVHNREEELRQQINPDQRLALLCGIQDYLNGDGKLGFAI